MHSWQGVRTQLEFDRDGGKTGSFSKGILLNQLFFACVRLKRGFLLEDLSDRLKVSSTTLSRISIRWLNVMYVNSKSCPSSISNEAKVDKIHKNIFHLVFGSCILQPGSL